ncbi:MAG TPA: adenylate/guanylate cyclase domain-containing protein, partial [Flavobacteriales bacterium]|nr:adenylate/guanylate cyclase domain-containing protein [Flavobacteriales bacterium]
VKKFQYDIWGDTVNTASRMESSGEVGRVNISEATYRAVVGSQLSVVGQGAGSRTTDNQQLTTPAFAFTPRGKVQAKGKGEMEMYFVERNEHAA